MHIRLGLLLLATMGSSGCVVVANVDSDWGWNANWAERQQDVEDVERVEFSARGTLYITQGRRNALKMEGNEKALEQLRIEERNGTLIITQAGDEYRWFEVRGRSEEPIYSLEISNLENIRHSGHGAINVGPFTLEALHIETSDHAQTYVASINARDVQISATDHSRVRIETLDSSAMSLRAVDHADVYIEDASVLDANIHAHSHGEVWLAGQADSFNVKLRDHSDVDAQEFASAVAVVNTSDHAKAQLQVSDEITLDQRDSSSVTITGDPSMAALE